MEVTEGLSALFLWFVHSQSVIVAEDELSESVMQMNSKLVPRTLQDLAVETT